MTGKGTRCFGIIACVPCSLAPLALEPGCQLEARAPAWLRYS